MVGIFTVQAELFDRNWKTSSNATKLRKKGDLAGDEPITNAGQTNEHSLIRK